MNNSRKILFFEFWIYIFICFCIIIIFENDFLLAGSWQDDKVTEYYVAIAMEIITILIIPLSLRLFKFGIVKCKLAICPTTAIRYWGTARLSMLAIPMLLNCWLYYMFVNVAFGYMSIICALSLLFVYPSKDRCDQETANDSIDAPNDSDKE